MNIARTLVRLYPEAFRSRWGPSLEEETRAAGWKAWPSLVAGIADMWLHPTIWPAASVARRHQRAATMAITVAAVYGLLTHAALELDPLLATGVARSWPMSAWSVLTLAGLVLVAPRPRLDHAALFRLLRRLTVRLAVPAILGAGVVAAVHTGVYDAAPAVLRPFLFACWWTALPLGALQGCRTIADLRPEVALPPPVWRLRSGLWILAAASAIPLPILLGTLVHAGRLDLLSAASMAGLLVSAPALVATVRDLNRVAAAASAPSHSSAMASARSVVKLICCLLSNASAREAAMRISAMALKTSIGCHRNTAETGRGLDHRSLRSDGSR
jgi:hypothetical protein